MRNIFSTLELEENPEYVTELEKKFSLQLPPIFKAFVQTFKFGVFNTLQQHTIIHINKELCYDGINHNLEFNMELYFDQGDFYLNDGVLPFASCCFDGICVGLSHEKIDKIFIVYSSLSTEKLHLVAENIFEFISQLKEVHWDSI